MNDIEKLDGVKVVGFSGYARSGKDTAYKAIKDFGYIRVAYADALKEDIINMIRGNVVDFSIELPKQKELIRPLLVAYGAFMRSLDEDYWVKRVHEKIAKSFKDSDGKNCKFCITDVRYKNEYESIHRLYDGAVIGIERNGIEPANEEERKSFSMFSPDYLVFNHVDPSENNDINSEMRFHKTILDLFNGCGNNFRVLSADIKIVNPKAKVHLTNQLEEDAYSSGWRS